MGPHFSELEVEIEPPIREDRSAVRQGLSGREEQPLPGPRDQLFGGHHRELWEERAQTALQARSAGSSGGNAIIRSTAFRNCS